MKSIMNIYRAKHIEIKKFLFLRNCKECYNEYFQTIDYYIS